MMNVFSKRAIVLASISLLLVMSTAAAVQSISSERVLPASVNTGEVFNVTVNLNNYGSFGMVNETIPAGFEFIGLILEDNISVNENAPHYLFYFFSLDEFTYTLKAPSTAGTYNFDGYLNSSITSVNITNAQISVVSSSGSSSSGSGGSGGGGGGGGTTGESSENILAKYSQLRAVFIGSNVNYEFDNASEITYLKFKGATNSGQIRTLIEILKNRSGLVNEDAPGVVYRNINIWVGNAAFGINNMNDPVIGFKVSKQWLSEKEIDPSSILLFNYDNGWKQLETTQSGEDALYFYYEAKATDFSHFAISASVVNDKDDSELELIFKENPGVEEEPITEEDKSTPGFSAIMFLIFVSIAFFSIKDDEKNK
jgi:PGF-pre-PGF domain-containing protein